MLQFTRVSHVVDAGDVTAGLVRIKRDLPNGAVLRVVNTLNEMRAWTQTSAEVMRFGDVMDTVKTLSLFHKILQPGIKDLHWEGSILMEGDFRTVKATWRLPIVAADVLNLTVGYE